MTSNESERISLRAAISERTARLRAVMTAPGPVDSWAMISLRNQIADLRAQLLENLNAALAERASRLETMALVTSWDAHTLLVAKALRAQMRDLETEKHALLQEV